MREGYKRIDQRLKAFPKENLNSGDLRDIAPLCWVMLPLMIWVAPWVVESLMLRGDQWDGDRLRRALLITAALAFAVTSTRLTKMRPLSIIAMAKADVGEPVLPKLLRDQLPGSTAAATLIAVTLNLSWMQYAALGGGEPLLAVQHILLNLFNVVGLKPTDIDGVRIPLDGWLAARPSLVSMRHTSLVVVDVVLMALMSSVMSLTAIIALTIRKRPSQGTDEPTTTEKTES
jgi:hypothetical protein